MPPIIDNALFGEAFSSIELTNAINDIAPEPDALTSEFTWTPTFSQTTSVRINKTESGAIDIASYTPRDGVPETIHAPKRSAINVEIPGISKRASAMNREALNVTAGITGAQRLLSLAELRNEKAREMDRSISRAEHRQVAEAVRGLLTNPTPILNGGNPTIILDLLGVLNAKQIEVDLDLTDSKNTLNDQLEEIKEISEQAIGGSAVIQGFKLIAGKNAFNSIRATKDWKDLLTDPVARYHAQVDGRKRIPINDNIEVVPYKFGYFAPDEAFLIPIYEGHAQVVYGPHDAEEFWGDTKPRYATTEEMPHGRGVEMEAWAFVLRYFQHPEANLKINVIPSV